MKSKRLVIKVADCNAISENHKVKLSIKRQYPDSENLLINFSVNLLLLVLFLLDETVLGAGGGIVLGGNPQAGVHTSLHMIPAAQG